MDKTTRLYTLVRFLSGRSVGVPLSRIMEELDCSRASAHRALQSLRNEFHAPIVFDTERGGYRLEHRGVELPGVWLNEAELLALLTMSYWLEQLGSGLMGQLLAPLQHGLKGMLARTDEEAQEIRRRIKLVAQMRRPMDPVLFETVCLATLKRRRLALTYHGRARDETRQRVISPQRLLHYRENWYVDAWCHQAEALRRFAMDAMSDCQVIEEAALDLQEEEWQTQMDQGYGAFWGAPQQEAVLRFNQFRSRWVAEEIWHPQQRGRWLDDGRYELIIPYRQQEELMLDILRYGADVEVISPPEIRRVIRQHLGEALRQYQIVSKS